MSKTAAASAHAKAPSSPTDQAGITRIPETERTHTSGRDTFWLWFSCNATVPSVMVGALASILGLGAGEAIFVAVLFTVLGALPVAFLSTLGPKTGLAQMPLSRFAFGFRGARFPAALNGLSEVGWGVVNTVIGASLLTSWSQGRLPLPVSLAILVALTTLISMYGYFVLQRFERLVSGLLVFLFGVVFLAVLPHLQPAALLLPGAASGLGLFAAVATCGGLVLAHAVGWASLAADFTRYQSANTPAARVFWYTLVGLALPCVVLETLGVTTVALRKE